MTHSPIEALKNYSDRLTSDLETLRFNHAATEKNYFEGRDKIFALEKAIEDTALAISILYAEMRGL